MKSTHSQSPGARPSRQAARRIRRQARPYTQFERGGASRFGRSVALFKTFRVN